MATPQDMAEAIQAMQTYTKPDKSQAYAAALRNQQMTHTPQSPLSSLQGQDPMTDWALGMQDRALHPLQTAADYSSEFQKLSPVDMGMQMVGGGMAGTVSKIGENGILNQWPKHTAGLFDTAGLENGGRELIQGKADELAQKLRDSGVTVDLQHSGSKAGPSSYIRVVGMPEIRISGHSKGVFNSGGVLNIASPIGQGCVYLS